MPRRHVSFTLSHVYASLFANTTAEFTLFIILAGLWFFRRWGAFDICFGARPLSRRRSIGGAVIRDREQLVRCLAERAIVAMSFVPPVRDVFATQT